MPTKSRADSEPLLALLPPSHTQEVTAAAAGSTPIDGSALSAHRGALSAALPRLAAAAEAGPFGTGRRRGPRPEQREFQIATLT